MLPSDIAAQAVQEKIKNCPDIKGFTIDPAGIPGLPPILCFQVDELTIDLAEAIYRIYLECKVDVLLSGYRVGTLPAVLDLD